MSPYERLASQKNHDLLYKRIMTYQTKELWLARQKNSDTTQKHHGTTHDTKDFWLATQKNDDCAKESVAPHQRIVIGNTHTT